MLKKTVPSRGGKPDFSASVSTLASSSTPSIASSASTLIEGSRPKKDRSVALGVLQNKLAFGCTPPTVPTPSEPKSSHSTPSQPINETKSAAASRDGARKESKDFEAAYGALSSTYGFGGSAVPSTSRFSK